MKGSFVLSSAEIDKRVTQAKCGNYALGYVNDEETFIVQYVGRSDENLGSRLKAWVDKGFSKFKYSYATSPKAAFEKECNNFHDFGGTDKLQNKVHPDRPNGSNWKCARCDIFE